MRQEIKVIKVTILVERIKDLSGNMFYDQWEFQDGCTCSHGRRLCKSDLHAQKGESSGLNRERESSRLPYNRRTRFVLVLQLPCGGRSPYFIRYLPVPVDHEPDVL